MKERATIEWEETCGIDLGLTQRDTTRIVVDWHWNKIKIYIFFFDAIDQDKRIECW